MKIPTTEFQYSPDHPFLAKSSSSSTPSSGYIEHLDQRRVDTDMFQLIYYRSLSSNFSLIGKEYWPHGMLYNGNPLRKEALTASTSLLALDYKSEENNG